MIPNLQEKVTTDKRGDKRSAKGGNIIERSKSLNLM